MKEFLKIPTEMLEILRHPYKAGASHYLKNSYMYNIWSKHGFRIPEPEASCILHSFETIKVIKIIPIKSDSRKVKLNASTIHQFACCMFCADSSRDDRMELVPLHQWYKWAQWLTL